MSGVDRYARRLEGLERKASSRTPQLGYSSLDDTTLKVKDAEGNLRMMIGRQDDGTYGSNSVGGVTPPTPSAPNVYGSECGVIIFWDGEFVDAMTAPLDFAYVEVHASTDPDFVIEPISLESTTMYAAMPSPRPCHFFIPAIDGTSEIYVRLLTRTRSGGFSESSGVVSAEPLAPPDGSDAAAALIATHNTDVNAHMALFDAARDEAHDFAQDVAAAARDDAISTIGSLLNDDYPNNDRAISTPPGSGLLGGGDLSADRNLSVDFGTGAGKVTQGNDARLSDARTPTAHTHSSADITDFTEAAQDAVASMFTSGANVTLTYNDVANTFQVTASGTDAEVVRDTVGAALVGINGVTVAINDPLDTITFSVTGLSISQTTGLQVALDSKLTASNNLSDLANTGTARTNLGLGNSATRAVGTTTGTVAAGDDSRFTDTRNPTVAAWQALTSTPFTVPTAFDAPGGRLEGVDVVRMRGTGVKNAGTAAAATIDTTTGAVTAGTSLGVLHSSLRPSKPRLLTGRPAGGAPNVMLVVNTDGNIYPYSLSVNAGVVVTFDGLSFTL